MQVNYYINGIEIEPPINAAELSVELNMDKTDSNAQTVNITEVEFGIGSQTTGNDAASLINEHRTLGLTSGVGVFEGLPYLVQLTHNGTTYDLFDGYLNTAAALWDCDRVIVGATQKGNIDWLSDVANSITFAYLYDPNNERVIPNLARITSADFVSIPYVNSELPNNREAFMAALSLYLISETLVNQLQQLIEYVAGITVLAWMDVVKILLRIAYVTGLFIATYKIVIQLINLLIQPLKYHDAMRVTTLCEKAANYYGFTFESSILYSDEFKDMVIIPNKYSHEINAQKDNIFGFLNPSEPESRGYYNGTFGELLTGLKEMFNGKIIIEGTTLKFEMENFNNSAYNYIVPDVDDTNYNLNFEDLYSNYTIEFLTDVNDKNTLQRYEGVLTQVIQTPKAVNNADMVLMTGLQSRTIPFARCTIKEEETLPEKWLLELSVYIDFVANQIVNLWNKIVETIQDIVDSLGTILTLIGLGLVNGFKLVVDLLTVAGINKIFGEPFDLSVDNLPTLSWTNIGDLIGDRIGMLTMENSFISTQKIGIFNINSSPSATKVSDNDYTYINSEYLYNNYHFLRTFVTDKYLKQPEGNQKKIKNVSGVPFCFEDYELLLNSNWLKDAEGNNGELISCKWNVEQQTAELDYFIRERYTNNIKETIITPDGK